MITIALNKEEADMLYLEMWFFTEQHAGSRNAMWAEEIMRKMREEGYDGNEIGA